MSCKLIWAGDRVDPVVGMPPGMHLAKYMALSFLSGLEEAHHLLQGLGHLLQRPPAMSGKARLGRTHSEEAMVDS